MKLDKELLTQHAKRLKAILNQQSTFAPYIARPDFSKVLENALNTLNAAEKKLTTVELSADLSAKTQVKEFNKLGKNEFKLDAKFKYDDEGDLIDNINYLVTYCNNIFKVNLDALVEGKKVTASNPTIDLKGKPEAEETAGAAGFAGAGFAGMGGVYENPFVMGKAYADIQNDINTGKLYVYSSKPRIIPIIKLVASICIGVASLLLIIMSVFAFLSKNYQVLNSEGKTITLGNSAIIEGVLYIIVALFGIYPLYSLIKSLKTKNDNIKYYFNWPWMLMYILMSLIFVMPDMRLTWLLSNTVVEQPGSIAWTGYQGWKILYILSMAFSGLCLIPMIIGAVCNPKQDKGLIESKLKEYADKVMASSGFGVPPTQPAGADVQKPVDVKKPEEDKSKDKPKDSKDTK